MKKDVWGYVFAGLSAAAGIAYVVQARSQGSQHVTNVFPPLNTSDPSSDITDQLPTSVNDNTGSTQSTNPGPVPYPVYLV